MLSERVVEGEWWVPGAPERVRGTLTLDRSKYSLHLRGDLLEHQRDLSGGRDLEFITLDEPVIFGTSDDGTDLTITDATSHTLRVPPGFVRASTWEVTFVVVGAHVGADTGITEVRLRTEHLDEWSETPRVSYEVEHIGASASRVDVSTTLKVIESAEVEGLGQVSVVAYPEPSVTSEGICVRSSAWVRFEPRQRWSLEDCATETQLLTELIRLGVGRSTARTEIRVRPDGSNGFATLLFRTSASLVERPKPANWHDMVMQRSKLPGGLGASITKWRNLREAHSSAWARLVSADHASINNVDESFLNYSQAIEALHGREFGRPTLAVVERDERVARAIASLPADLIEWATPLLEASSPPIFRHRVLELVASLGTLGDRLTGSNPDRFARRVTATRNALTHPHARRTKDVLTDAESKFIVGRALQHLGIAFLLVKLGLPVERVRDSLEENSTTGYTIEQMASLMATAP